MRPLYELLPYLKPYRLRVAITVAATVGVTAASLVSPWLVREMVRLVRVGEGAIQAITWLAVGLIAAYALRGIFEFLSNYVGHIVAWNFCHDLRVAIHAHLQRLSLRYYSERQSGEIVSRVIRDTDHMEPLIADISPYFIVNGLMMVGIAVILFWMNPPLAALTLIPLPLVLLFLMRLRKRIYPAFRKEAEQLGDLSALVQDNVSGIREIQVFGRERRESARMEGISGSYARDQVHARKLVAFLQPLVELAAGVGIVLVVYFGGRSAIRGGVPIENLIAFVLYLNIFYQSLRQLAQMSEMAQRAAASARRIREVLSLSPEVADPPHGADPGRAQGEVRFENVGFEYVEGRPVLEDISFTVEPGQTLALVGPTGAGKSTIAALIPRFYDPKEGGVKIDGHDLTEMRLEAVRANVSMVLQDTFLFNGTVTENLRFGSEDATDEEILRATRAANAHGFIQELPEGYETQVGERGIKLSGGQKQRISIARALLKDAPILILDEATSSVDAETEAGIQAALKNLMAGRTSVVIAHRLSTVRDADKIAVLDEGRIAELGLHEELISRKGLYSKLYERQLGTIA